MIHMEEPIQTDLLIVGGGIGGLMAAINAADHGAKVIVAEKANTRRSGNGATGNDHFLCYIPEVHGDDIDAMVNEQFRSQAGKFQDKNLIITHLRESFDRVKDWDSWGIPMKVDGKWEFTGHSFPGRPRIWLKYAGANQKAILTREAKKRGVIIMNKLSITELITTDEKIIGAIGINSENIEPKLIVFRTKSIIIATGDVNRLYPSLTPGWLFNVAHCPVCVGTGRAMAYRAGAKLINLELPYTHSGTKYFARSGKGTWIGVLKDYYGKPVGPFVNKPNKELGDITADIWTSVFSEMHKAGRGPVYMDCSETSEEDLEYMVWGLKNEGGTAMLDYMEKEGIDLKKHLIEFGEYEIHLRKGGVEINERTETIINGFFAAGSEVGNFQGGISSAATYGWIAGKNAAKYIGSTDFEKAEESSIVKDRLQFYSNIMNRETGPNWKEANIALQQLMNDYAGKDVRSESLLSAGLKYLRDLKEKVSETVIAKDAHTLIKVLEVQDLIDIGELIFLTALERKESRGKHKRTDYTFTNPLLDDKFMTIRQVAGKPQIEWRDRVS